MNMDEKILKKKILANKFNSTLKESYMNTKWDLSLDARMVQFTQIIKHEIPH